MVKTSQSMGGNIKATGGMYGAGIGGAARNAAHGVGKNIIINAGKIVTTGGKYGAGIGGASTGNGEYITINGGNVTATGGEYSAGIGGGDYGYGNNIMVNGGTVISNGSNNADGIGAGNRSSGGSSENIKAGQNVSIKAGSSINPSNTVANETPGVTDLATRLSGKQYVLISPSTATISFDSNGGSTVASSSVDKNTKVTKPANPTKSGYTFGGWYKESACTNAWDFNTNVTEDITLYAKWNKVEVVSESSTTATTTTPTTTSTSTTSTPTTVKSAYKAPNTGVDDSSNDYMLVMGVSIVLLVITLLKRRKEE